MKKLLTILSAFALFLGLSVVSAPAQAVGGGRVSVTAGSTGSVWVSDGYSEYTGKPVMVGKVVRIKAGQTSRSYMYDADAFRTPAGCTTYYMLGRSKIVLGKGKIYKINNLTHRVLTVKC